MFDKSNPNYKLYLAGVISESQYMDLCELVDPYSAAMNPTGKTLAGKPAPTDAPKEIADDVSEEEIKQFKTMLHKPIELLLARLKQANYGDAQKKQFMTTLIHTLSDELNLKDNQVAGAVRQSYKL
jgi:hypothetical protein